MTFKPKVQEISELKRKQSQKNKQFKSTGQRNSFLDFN